MPDFPVPFDVFVAEAHDCLDVELVDVHLDYRDREIPQGAERLRRAAIVVTVQHHDNLGAFPPNHEPVDLQALVEGLLGQHEPFFAVEARDVVRVDEFCVSSGIRQPNAGEFPAFQPEVRAKSDQRRADDDLVLPGDPFDELAL